jgi:hypothetical protein
MMATILFHPRKIYFCCAAGKMIDMFGPNELAKQHSANNKYVRYTQVLILDHPRAIWKKSVLFLSLRRSVVAHNLDETKTKVMCTGAKKAKAAEGSNMLVLFGMGSNRRHGGWYLVRERILYTVTLFRSNNKISMTHLLDATTSIPRLVPHSKHARTMWMYWMCWMAFVTGLSWAKERSPCFARPSQLPGYKNDTKQGSIFTFSVHHRVATPCQKNE